MSKRKVRLGIRYRVGVLGALGSVALLLVGVQYFVGQRTHAAMDLSATRAEQVSAGFARVLGDLTEAHYHEETFRLTGQEAAAGQHAVAMEAVAQGLAEVTRHAGGAEGAVAEAELVASPARLYSRRFDDLVGLQRFLGSGPGDGLTLQLGQSGQAVEDACASLGSERLLVAALRLRREAASFVAGRQAGMVDRFNAGAGAMLAEIAGMANLDGTAARHLAGLVGTYQRDMLEYAEQARLVAQKRFSTAEAFETARVAAEAARGLSAGVAEQWETTIAATQASTERRMLWLLGVSAATVALLAFILGRDIARPLERVAAATQLLARGDDQVVISDVNRRDEVGDVARALAVFRGLTTEYRGLTQQREARRDEEEAARRDAITALAGQIEAAIGSLVHSAGDAARGMRTGAEAVVATIGQTRVRAGAAAASSLECSGGVQSVAAATEQLAATLDEVCWQVKRSADATGRASAQMKVSGQIVQALATSALQVDRVVTLIANVATRTNLLALNATIEAARAGSAGRGFAVVATEIKALANQTGTATQDIRAQIADMQVATRQAVDAMRAVTDEFAGMDLGAAAVAAAVEQQQEATREIARSAQLVAAGVETVSDALEGLRDDAERADGVAQTARQASDGVAAIAQDLSCSLAHVLADLRARA